MGNVGEQRPQRHHELGSEGLRELDYDLGESPPAHRWLGPDEQDQISGRPRDPRLIELNRRPDDRTGLTVHQLDLGPGRLEVVELLGIDRGKAPRAERAADEGQRGRGRVSRVVPALERADQRGSAQTVGAIFPLERMHLWVTVHDASDASGRFGRSLRGIRPAVDHGLVTPHAATDVTVREDRTLAVSELRAGGEVNGVYACTRKDRLMTRNGSPYLSLELRDQTGVIQARAFRDADALAGRFERGDLVRAAGRVERFRDELVVELLRIERVAADEAIDPGAFLPHAYRDLDELDGFLEHLAVEVHDRQYRGLLDGLLGDAGLRAEWRRAPCSRTGHHAYLGGLLEHTVAVATLAHDLCQLHPRLKPDLLLTAALVHDLGRTQEFTYGAEIGLTEEGRLLGHLVVGERIISERGAALDSEHHLALLHCVITHHGPSTAPGGKFASAEALALFRLNAVDASVKGAFEQGL
jgi:3'-5' exoribonuclease